MDPIGGSIASPSTLNGYVYSGDNPVNTVDLSGQGGAEYYCTATQEPGICNPPSFDWSGIWADTGLTYWSWIDSAYQNGYLDYVAAANNCIQGAAAAGNEFWWSEPVGCAYGWAGGATTSS
jgi:hypothetical protein